MLTALLRLTAELGLRVTWILIFMAAVITVFVLYIGIAIWGTLRAQDAEQRKILYQVLHDLLDLFRGGRNK